MYKALEQDWLDISVTCLIPGFDPSALQPLKSTPCASGAASEKFTGIQISRSSSKEIER